ncbi:MAG: three-Cys-motif partner protein TcmP [Myxococcales bacterium]|nr:three-Cys-motif partner protein TcmP [Myxococcales bacterium]
MELTIPADYRGREQTYLKHRVLAEYVLEWGIKLGSAARRRAVRLWYVDGFAGPWRSRNAGLKDTSIDVGLATLERAAAVWRQRGYALQLAAIFVEKDANAYERLKAHLEGRRSSIETLHCFGEFGVHAPWIERTLGDDPALVFIDPTGVRGAAMRFIEPLTRRGRRDVLINVMFEHIHRFKTRMPERIREFFDLEDGALPEGLDERALLERYRENLKRRCHLRHAADMAVPHPNKQGTYFHLVIGGKHRAALDVFRRVEAKVIGRDAAEVREQVRSRQTEERSGQLSLDLSAPDADLRFARELALDRARAVDALVERLRTARAMTWATLWPPLLERYHLTLPALARLVQESAAAGRLVIQRSNRARARLGARDRITRP